MRLPLIAALAFVAVTAGCGRTDAPDLSSGADVRPAATSAMPPASANAKPGWHMVSGSEGTALAVDDASGGTALRVWCKRGEGRLRVNGPAFTPIASEERMAFGQGGEVVAMVAGASGDATRGGVTAETALPANLHALLSGPVSATYGAQVSGPHPVPPPALVSAFVDACALRAAETGDVAPVEADTARAGGDMPPAMGDAPTSSSPARASACLVQDGQSIPAGRLRAVGTEPFWGAQVDGRCVTWSHPGNPAGTRVWTRFTGSVQAGVWRGALNGTPFVLRTRPHAGCSDGMSDTRYPIAVSLTVDGVERSGCASPR